MPESEYVMDDILRGTDPNDTLRSLAHPAYPDPERNYRLIRDMLQSDLELEESELDDSLSVTRLQFRETPKWLKYLDQNPFGFPHRTLFGTIWSAVDMCATGGSGRTAFASAVKDGDLLRGEMLAGFADADVTAADNGGRTALHWAAVNRHAEMVGLCLVVGIDSGVRDNDNCTAFDIASQAGDEICALFHKHVFDMEKTAPDAAMLQLLTLTSEAGVSRGGAGRAGGQQ